MEYVFEKLQLKTNIKLHHLKFNMWGKSENGGKIEKIRKNVNETESNLVILNSMKTKYIINTEEDIVEYIIENQAEFPNTTTELHYSKSTEWTTKVRGKKCISITDNGSIIDLYLQNGNSVRLEYDELSELILLLKHSKYINWVDHLQLVTSD
jgi:hypothetical protein